MRRISSGTASLGQRTIWITPDGACLAIPLILEFIFTCQWRYAASLVISTTYGKTTPTTYSDPEVKGIVRVARHFSTALRPGAYLIDTYPFLKCIPGYLSHLYKHHEEELVFFHELIADVKRKIVRAQLSE